MDPRRLVVGLGFLSAMAMAAGLVLAPAAPADDEKKPDKPYEFTLADHNGKKVSLADFADRIVVLEWMNYDCPFSVRHYKRGTFKGLAGKYKDKGVVWLAVNSTHYATAEKNKEWAGKHGVPYPILDDHAGDVGHLFDAKTTPDIRILKGGKVAYKGGIDDDPGGTKTAPTPYVDRALEELTSGKDVTTPETKPYGCSVKYAKGK